MADTVEDRIARLKGKGKRGPNTTALVAVALVTGLGVGGIGVAYYLNSDGDAGGGGSVVLDTSDSREFERNSSAPLRPVITPDPQIQNQEPEAEPEEDTPAGPSEAELALRARVSELERILEEARSDADQEPQVDTARIEELQSQLDGLNSDMESREAEMSQLSGQRDELRREVRRQQSEIAGLELQIEQAATASQNRQRAAEAEEDRRRELEERRAEAEAVREAQIRSPMDGLSGGGGSSSSDERDYSGDEAFVRAGADTISPTRSQVIGALSNTVMAGTMIEATLTTGINSSLSGTITATVSHDIWSFDMRRVLIPRGSQMLGRYSSGVALGQRRVLVAWDRVTTPDGQVVALDAYGSDRLGRSGLTGRVDTRFAQRFGSAALISVFGALPNLASSGSENEENAVVIGDLTEGAGNNASGMVEEYLSLTPVITVEHGDVINVMVTNDLELF